MKVRWIKAALAILALFALALAVHMIAAPAHWYHATAGVSETGPFNPHFVRDIGIAFLTGAAAIALAAFNAAARVPLLSVALIWFGGHGLLHLAEAATDGHAGAGLVLELFGIGLPALLILLALAHAVRKNRT